MMVDENGTPKTNRISFIGRKFLAGLIFLLLSLAVVCLYGNTLLQIWLSKSSGGIWIGCIVLGLLAALLIQTAEYHFDPGIASSSIQAVLTIITHISGAVATYFLSQTMHLSPVLASALIGLLGGLLFPKWGAEIFCGSFVGMSSMLILARYSELLAASALAGLIFHLGRNFFQGFGGKLGTTAFCSILLIMLGTGSQIFIRSDQAIEFSWPIIFTAVSSTVLTYLIANFKNTGAVVASSLVGLIGGGLLPVLFPDQGNLFAVVIFCASFTGMSAKTRLPSIPTVILAGLVTGIIFQFSAPVFNGIGGKLGATAFGASLVAWVFNKLFHKLIGSTSK